MTDDLTGPRMDVRSDAERADAPILPIDIDAVTIDSIDVLGGLEVQNTAKTGGVWSLVVQANFPATAMNVIRVGDRLEPGTYILARIEGGDDDD